MLSCIFLFKFTIEQINNIINRDVHKMFKLPGLFQEIGSATVLGGMTLKNNDNETYKYNLWIR